MITIIFTILTYAYQLNAWDQNKHMKLMKKGADASSSGSCWICSELPKYETNHSRYQDYRYQNRVGTQYLLTSIMYFADKYEELQTWIVGTQPMNDTICLTDTETSQVGKAPVGKYPHYKWTI